MIISLILYLAVVLVISYFASRRLSSREDFLIAGRKLGSLTTAFSSEATSMSGWLLLGFPGQVFKAGLSAVWVGIGCILGDYFNWKVVADRVRIMSRKNDLITLSEVITGGQGSSLASVIKFTTSVCIVFFMTIYLWAQFIATGKALSSMSILSISYQDAVLIGSGIIILYTFFGGFLSVVWTDVFQALVIVSFLTVTPIVAIINVLSRQSSLTKLMNTPSLIDVNSPIGDMFGQAAGFTIFALLISSFGIGAAYTGQPQLVQRYIAAKSSGTLNIARKVGVAWVTISVIGVTILALSANILLDNKNFDPENVIFEVCSLLMPQWTLGIVYAAIMAAIMSSADSFLINAVCSIQQDMPLRKKLRDSMLFSRILVLILGIVAIYAAWNTDIMDKNLTVFKVVNLAWGGLSISFAIPLIYSIVVEKVDLVNVLSVIISGLVLMFIWHYTGLSNEVYEVFPCFTLQSIICLVIHKMR